MGKRGLCTFCARELAVKDLVADRRGNLVCTCDEILGREEDLCLRADGAAVFDGGRSAGAPAGFRRVVEGERGHRRVQASFPVRHPGLGQVALVGALGLLAVTGWLLSISHGDLAGTGALLPAAFLGYVALGAFFNRIELSVAERRIVIRATPFPLPLRSPKLALDGSDLEQIHCRTRSLTAPSVDLRVAGGVGSYQAPTEVTCSVLAVGPSRSLTVLEDLPDADTALAVASALRAGLDLEPGPSARTLAASPPPEKKRRRKKKRAPGASTDPD